MSDHVLRATVYLNDAPHSFSGFNRVGPARLRRAASFELSIPAGTRPVHTATAAALEHVFEQLNVDDPATAWAQCYRLARHRSLSVGDVVVIGETAWAVAAIGWSPVSADEFAAALTDR